MANKPSEKLLKRVRDYAVSEPSFTNAFASWDLSTNHDYVVSPQGVANAVTVLLEQGVVELIEDAGRGGKVYAYVPPAPNVTRIEPRTTKFPELDASYRESAVARGVPVAHVTPRGSTGKPGKDRKLQERGFKIKRQRQGT